ncbi:MAG TPA: 2,3-bisphosphoglycerate-dependent phosphoglycerate mutase [Aggregatilineaceae bacterium]|nr:2,3-bisphosphoglycerate-dependent phosphoglycerate mutase [Aggregatilineaceae bacterium]
MALGTLILVRHGQSIWNLENRFTGWMDVPLTPQGEQEAYEAGLKLREYRFDRGFTSALVRAHETLRIILDVIQQTDLPVLYDAALNERHYGELQGLNKAETAEKLGQDVVHAWRRSYTVRPPGGESLKDTAERVLPYYHAQIEPHVLKGETVLVVAHGNSLRALVMVLDQISEAEIPSLNIPTGVPRRYVIEPNGIIVERGYL